MSADVRYALEQLPAEAGKHGEDWLADNRGKRIGILIVAYKITSRQNRAYAGSQYGSKER